ncbi:hypothetical protein HDU85_007505 [Gaertneriomyces sp. JEL0708]|nr:hypothetical protein HDU85_007505 [Gaertneriomyces sp. JEL0708]
MVHQRRCESARNQGGESSPAMSRGNSDSNSVKRERSVNSSGSSMSPQVEEFPDDFPSELQELNKQFRALNTVYTFFTVQRQVVCTMDLVEQPVERLTGRRLTLEDLGAIKTVAEHLIEFAWTKREDLEAGSIKEMYDAEESALAANDVLLIQFLDSRPTNSTKQKKRSLDDGNQKSYRGYSVHDQMETSGKRQTVARTMQRRERTFTECLLQYHRRHLEQDWNPVESLRQAAIDAIPQHPWKQDLPSLPPLKQQELPLRPASLEGLLQTIKSEPFYRDQIIEGSMRTDEARVAAYAPLDVPMTDDLAAGLLQASNISKLYAHQAQAINHVESGHSVVVSTPTSSGKSLIYQLPVLRALENDSRIKAFYIFPTKALAQDQKRAFRLIVANTTGLSWVQAETYDGDTSLGDSTRESIRKNASVIFTNPDMLHLSILPQHRQWKAWFEKLRFVIVDELHYYSSGLGSHCAMIMRRLRRLCHIYHNDSVKFISCSATVGNPGEHMASFFGLPSSVIRVVDQNTSPSGRKISLIWNPPFKNERHPSEGRVSSLDEAARVIVYLMCRGVRTICFAKVRRMCELLLKEALRLLREVAPTLADRIMSYRGGYTAADRREIEGRMFNGELLCIVATNALELGVDIGSLDAVVHVGFPFNMASYRQQSGRAGRRERDSMSILVADGDSPLDQFYCKNPRDLYESVVDASHVELTNEMVVEAHLQCAAYEWPLDLDRDAEFFAGEQDVRDICMRHLRWDDIHKVYFARAKYTSHPAKTVHIRSIDEETFQVIDTHTHQVIEAVEAPRVPFTLYEGSVFIHQGRTFLVMQVDAEQKVARVRSANVDYITINRDFTDIDPMKVIDAQFARALEGEAEAPQVPPVIAYYGELKVVTTVFGYFKINPRTKQRLEAVSGIENPPYIRTRYGFWLNVPDRTLQILQEQDLPVDASIHAASHAVLSLLPSCVMIPTTGQTDLRTDCKNPLAQRIRPPR